MVALEVKDNIKSPEKTEYEQTGWEQRGKRKERSNKDGRKQDSKQENTYYMCQFFSETVHGI